MPNTFFGLNIGTSGLYASNVALNVTGNNISNINTKGYSKQEADMAASSAIRVYQKYGTLGTGVEVTDIKQIRDEYYDIKYRKNQTLYGEESMKKYYLSEVEQQFNETITKGFTAAYDVFFDTLSDLNDDPSGYSTRNAMLNSAQTFLEFVEQMKTNLLNIQEDLNLEVSSKVDETNTIASAIATLNKQINVIELTGANANSLRDERNLLLDQLSKIVPVTTKEEKYITGGSEYRVYIGDEVLVNGYDYYTLNVVTRENSQNKYDAAGLYEVEWSDGREFDILGNDYTGELNALLLLRDGNNGVLEEENTYCEAVGYKGVPYYLNKLNGFLDSFANEINAVHNEAQIINVPADEIDDISGDIITSYYDYVNGSGQTVLGYLNHELVGEQYVYSFMPTDEYDALTTEEKLSMDITGLYSPAAGMSPSWYEVSREPQNIYGDSTVGVDIITKQNGKYCVNKDIIDNPNLMATSRDSSSGPENQELVQEWLDLKNANSYMGNTASEYIQSIVTEISIDTKRATTLETNYTNIQLTINNQRLSISGVDEDEESMNLVKFQEGYNLSAKMIQVMSEIYDKLINETGV